MPTNQKLLRRGLQHFATCTNCGQPITITAKAVFHRLTGTVSCRPVERDGFFSEPADLWSGKRAAS